MRLLTRSETIGHHQMTGLPIGSLAYLPPRLVVMTSAATASLSKKKDSSLAEFRPYLCYPRIGAELLLILIHFLKLGVHDLLLGLGSAAS